MFLLRLLLVLNFFLATGASTIPATPTSTTPTTTYADDWQYGGGFNSVCNRGSLIFDPLTTLVFKPEPDFKNDTTFVWSSYGGGSEPQVEITICEFTGVHSFSYETSNVESTANIVDGIYQGRLVDRNGNVLVTTRYDSMSSYKTGWKIKIALTPKNNQAPVVMKNLDIQVCWSFYDCFANCAVYLLDPTTGCKEPRCVSSDPCRELFCNDDQECRLIEDKDFRTFPSFMTPDAQLWGCVDKNRTDYGCVCKEYGVSEYECPTCNCGRTTTTQNTL